MNEEHCCLCGFLIKSESGKCILTVEKLNEKNPKAKVKKWFCHFECARDKLYPDPLREPNDPFWISNLK
jgi:hypothetical protein